MIGRNQTPEDLEQGKVVSILPQPSDAMRMQKPYRFHASEVSEKHDGKGVLLPRSDSPWQILVAGLESPEPGWQLSRDQPEPLQTRSTR